MTSVSQTVPQPIPFVDLHALHQPIQKDIDAAIAEVLTRGDFILGQAVRDFEAAFAQACGVEHAVGVACELMRSPWDYKPVVSVKGMK